MQKTRRINTRDTQKHDKKSIQFELYNPTYIVRLDDPSPVMALNGASTNISIFAPLSNISIGTVHYRYWHEMVTVPVLAFMHFGPIPVLAWHITSNGIKWCLYQYWHICTFVQYQYWHGTLPVLA
jgi:hypothetical protein